MLLLLLLCVSFENGQLTLILISFGQVSLYDSVLDFLELNHCVVLELVFLPNRFLQKGEMSQYYAM